MTIPTPPTYYNDFLDSNGLRQPSGRCPRVLDIYFKGPPGCGYIYTPTLHRNSTTTNGATLSLMISTDGNFAVNNFGPTGIQFAYKLALDGTDFNVGSTFYNSPSIPITVDNIQGITLGRGMSIALGLSFGSSTVQNGLVTRVYIVNQTAGNSGELIWRITYVPLSGEPRWYQYGPHESNNPIGGGGNSDGLAPPLAFSYGATYDGSGKTGYTGASPTDPNKGFNSFPGSAQFGPYPVTPIL